MRAPPAREALIGPPLWRSACAPSQGMNLFIAECALLLPAIRMGTRGPMSEVSRILSAIEQGDPSAAGQLLPLVYAGNGFR